MRCPKCQYISFDSGERCRNCGYEFSLSPDEPQVDVTIGRDQPPPGRVDDLSLTAFDAPIASAPTPGEIDRGTDLGPTGRRPLTAADLPLFTERFADNQAPLVTPPAVPRPPLSVRRATPRSRPSLPEELELDLDAADAARAAGREGSGANRHEPDDAAGLVRRTAAGLVDTSVLLAIHAAVVYLTLRACELTPEQWRMLPLLPLVAFLLLLCGGYFILFTAAGGQTIGKMTTGIRVVFAPAGGRQALRVSFRTATIRTVASLGSVLALGTGFLPVLLNADRRAFHDRIAETRVIVA